MQHILFLITCFVVMFIFHRHQTDARIDEVTNISNASNKLQKMAVDSTHENKERSTQDFLQRGAEDVIDLKHEEHMHSRNKTNIFYVNSKPKKPIFVSKSWREKSQAGFLHLGAEVLSDIKGLRDEGHSREKKFSSNDMDIWETKSQTSSNIEPNIFEDVEDYPDIKQDETQMSSNKIRQHYSDMTKARSSRQRRTVGAREKTLVCQEELSCRNKCHNPRKVSYQAQLSCFCDEDCEFFEDCCADYDDFCGTNGQTNSTIRNKTTTENLVTQENKDLWSCYIGEGLKGTLGIWMIGSCPSSWPEDDILYRCRNLSIANTITKDNYRYLPVYTSNGRVYHNRFCAQCNGVSLKNLSEFSLFVECDFTPPRHLGFESTISYLFSYCQRLVFWSPKKGNPRRYCLNIRPVSKCFSRFNIDKNKTFTKCMTGKPRIVTSKYFYSNIYCAKCENQMNRISCGPNIAYVSLRTLPALSPKPFSVIFDFNNDNTRGHDLIQIKTPCPSNKVYDHYLDICRDAIPALLSLSEFYEYRVVLWLKPSLREYSPFKIYRQAIAQALSVPIQNVRNISLNKPRISFILRIRKNQSLEAIVQNILDFTSPLFNITLIELVYTVVKATKRILTCGNRQTYDRSEYTVLQFGSSAVSIKKTGEVFEAKDYYINTTEAATSANDSQAIFVCRQHQISNCSGVYIMINGGEFRVLINKSIFVNASKQVYDWSEYTWINKSVLVCENFSTTYYKVKLVSNDDPVLTTLTIVCMSLSIIGLVFVLVTYSLFSELRTPPGINLMNLSVSILLAQLLWLLGSGQTDTPMACTVIAVILHYLFLVSFVWTSIIAFDTWKAFSAENRIFSDSKRGKCVKVLRQVTVGWLPALVYMGICVTLDFTDTVNIGYKSRIACWMANKWAILYFFAVPVFMLLVFNFVFCMLTFRAIKVTTAQARAASDHNTQKNFGIYVRIASLMGFTWIFGFAAPFGWQFLWYPFVILNGLQGVYIALAFSLSKRARGLYKILFKGRSLSIETTNTSLSKSRTSHTDLNRSIGDSKL